MKTPEQIEKEIQILYKSFCIENGRKPDIILLSYNYFYELKIYLNSLLHIEINGNKNKFPYMGIDVTWAGMLEDGEIKIY